MSDIITSNWNVQVLLEGSDASGSTTFTFNITQGNLLFPPWISGNVTDSFLAAIQTWVEAQDWTTLMEDGDDDWWSEYGDGLTPPISVSSVIITEFDNTSTAITPS